MGIHRNSEEGKMNEKEMGMKKNTPEWNDKTSCENELPVIYKSFSVSCLT